MKVRLPKGKYIKTVEVNNDGLDIQFADKKQVAVVLISINERYWPYLKQVLEDCKRHFLPHHKVEYLVWTDMPELEQYQERLGQLMTDAQIAQPGGSEKARAQGQFFSREVIENTIKAVREDKNITIFPTDAIDWPAPTLMRYHLFLNEEEKLKDYDYIFYLDADMRILDKISDEVLGEGLTVAEHPMYSLRREYVPPYEPNKDSAAFIPRLGMLTEENGKQRFKPLYLAGGFQGGKSALFIEAMKKLKEGIDKDFNKNYTAIWNDESHWNKYVFENANPIDGHPTVVLHPGYIFPDSLIKEYYIPIWGKEYPPKIMTLTKPFSLTKEGGAHLNEFFGNKASVFQCPTCKDNFETQGQKVTRVVHCPGSGKPHPLEFQK